MRERIEKFVVMPFTIRTCSAHSSVAIKDHNLTTTRPLSKHKNTQGNIATSNHITPSHSHSKNSIRKVKEQAISQSGRIESSSTFMHTKSQISSKLHRLIKEGIKALSQLFVYKEEEEEMQIGYPTDVKHVAHIGWDGSSSASAVKSWMDETKSGDERRRNSSSDIEQPRCSRWVDDPSTLPTWAAHDLLGSLGLHPSNKNASRFEFFNAADAKAERAESQMTSSKH